MYEEAIKNATEKFAAVLKKQLERNDRIKADKEFLDFSKLDKIIIGVVGGDGIGPAITRQAHRILEFLLADEVKAGKVEFKVIDGLTIENRVSKMQPIPDDVL